MAPHQRHQNRRSNVKYGEPQAVNGDGGGRVGVVGPGADLLFASGGPHGGLAEPHERIEGKLFCDARRNGEEPFGPPRLRPTELLLDGGVLRLHRLGKAQVADLRAER